MGLIKLLKNHVSFLGSSGKDLTIYAQSYYQDMEGKNKDDDDKTNSTKESMHANQFADLVAQPGLEQQRSCSRY